MPGMSRHLDIWAGICCCHRDPRCIGMAGVIITCSGNVTSSHRGNARIGDITIGACGHPGVIISGSRNVQINERGAARIGDLVAGCNIGVIVTGDYSTIANGG